MSRVSCYWTKGACLSLQARAAGAVAFLPKPIDERTLLEAVYKVLGRVSGRDSIPEFKKAAHLTIVVNRDMQVNARRQQAGMSGSCPDFSQRPSSG